MSIKLNHKAARGILEDALEIAKSEKSLPVEWISHTRSVFALDAMTWTPALATILLAKSLDSQLDVMSLKVDPENEYSYSARGLCHNVIVPAAIERNFAIRNTGREPLNNQPFFRYQRLDELDRVKNSDDRDFFLGVAKKASDLTAEDAALALAAFLKVALEVRARVQSVKVKGDGLTPAGARIAAVDYLRTDASDRPRRLQAFAAACMDLVFNEVRTRRINDPSKDSPGDVQVLDESGVALAMEVRGKRVSPSDVTSFAQACFAADITRAVVFVDSDQQEPLNVDELTRTGNLGNLQVMAFTSVADLLASTLLWNKSPTGDATESFPKLMLERLQEIEVPVSSLKEWARAVAIAQGR